VPRCSVVVAQVARCRLDDAPIGIAA
jgi:hypothetical protein